MSIKRQDRRGRHCLWLMRNKLAVCMLCLAGGAVGAQGRGSLRYTVELENLQGTAERLELRIPGWRVLAVERRLGLEPEYLAFGLACPVAAFGPLAPRGLLRALADPLGYSPGSEVFAERAGYRLEGSLEGTSRRGLWLEPLPGRLGLFALHSPPAPSGSGPAGPVQAGGVARIRLPAPGAAPAGDAGSVRAAAPARAEVEALALLSLPAPASAPPAGDPQDWLREPAPFPGGKLAHLGGSVRLEAGAGDDLLACCLLGAASGGERVTPGLFSLLELEAARRSWRAIGLAGACTEGYRAPDGELYRGAWAAGLRLEAQPGPGWWLAGSWRRRVDRPPAAPGRSLPGSQEGELLARMEALLPTGGRLEAKARAQARASYAADGGVQRWARGVLEVGLRRKETGLALELQGAWDEAGGELRGLLRGQKGGCRVEVGAAGDVPPRPSGAEFPLRPFGRLELAGRKYHFWVSVQESGEEVSLGWSAAQALPVSPTSRTSRSRR